METLPYDVHYLISLSLNHQGRYSLYLTCKDIYKIISIVPVDMLIMARELGLVYKPNLYKEILVTERYTQEVLVSLVEKNDTRNFKIICRDFCDDYLYNVVYLKKMLSLSGSKKMTDTIKKYSRSDYYSFDDGTIFASEFVLPDSSLEEILENQKVNGISNPSQRGLEMIVIRSCRWDIVDYLLTQGKYNIKNIERRMELYKEEIYGEMITCWFDYDNFLNMVDVLEKHNIMVPKILVIYAAYGPRIEKYFSNTMEVINILKRGHLFCVDTKREDEMFVSVIDTCIRNPFGKISDSDREKLKNIDNLYYEGELTDVDFLEKWVSYL